MPEGPRTSQLAPKAFVGRNISTAFVMVTAHRLHGSEPVLAGADAIIMVVEALLGSGVAFGLFLFDQLDGGGQVIDGNGQGLGYLNLLSQEIGDYQDQQGYDSPGYPQGQLEGFNIRLDWYTHD